MDVSFTLVAVLAVLFPDPLRSQPTPEPVETSLPGPCRSWLFPCGHGVWTCTTELAYWEFIYGPQPGCPSLYPQTTAPPPGECRMVGGACQFTNTTLECTTRLNSCQGYQCVSASDITESPGCAFGGQYPQPDELCLPINGSCQWYDPCVSWPGFCQSGYRCGSIDQYYQFMFGPQPICVPRPPNWVRPPPPGECTVTNGQCQWNNCTAWLDWCQTYWLCGTEYDEDVYQAGPPPPCPAPPPGYRPPPQPGTCQFNVSAGQCQFQPVTTTAPPTGCPNGTQMVSCFSDPCGECPNYPNARCEANYCGGCYAVYYDQSGNNVTDYCRTYTTAPPTGCPNGTEMVSCFSDPCGECPNYPNARCEANYCGGCYAVYYDQNGNIVTDYCMAATTAPPTGCPNGTEMVSCFSDPCGECPNYPNARCEANYCGGCYAVYYDQSGNNVTDYCRTYTGCEVILCTPGAKCVGNPVTSSAYCDPSCDPPYNMHNCGDEQRCVLTDGVCPPDQTEPCPHQVQCIDIEPNPCALVDCQPKYTCRVNPSSNEVECLPSTCSLKSCSPGEVCEIDAGIAYCVASCESSNGGCADYQWCSVEEYDHSWCDPSPCRYAVCYNAPYVPCSSTNVRAKCAANSRCLVQNKTGEIACVQSCFEENGGCERDQVCINTVGECTADNYPYQCASQVKCLAPNDISPECPAGWEYSNCGSNCGATCESVLGQSHIVCPAVCYIGCFCPRGLVAYRDRCVDPKECYTLINSPPSANPLPVTSSTVFLSMTLPQVTSERFKNETQQFLASLQRLLGDNGYSGISLTIHAVFFDQELQVVVQMSGDRINAAESSELVKVIDSNANALLFQVKNVAAVPTLTAAPSEAGGLSMSATVSIAVVVVVVALLLVTVTVAVTVVVLLKGKTNQQIREQDISNDMIYSKLSGGEESLVVDGEEFVEDLQGEKVDL